MIKIIYLITDLRYGGAQNVLRYLLPHLDRSRFAPQVVCLYGGKSPLSQQIQSLNIPVTDLRIERRWPWPGLYRLVALLRREKPQILHTSLFHAVLAGRLAGRLTSVPVLVSWRQNVSLGGWHREWLNRLTVSLDDCVVAASQAVKQAEHRCAGTSRNRVVVVYNAIEVPTEAPLADRLESNRVTRESLGIPEQAFLIGSVGRLHPQKGLEDLLHAFARVIPTIPEAWLLIVGEGPLQSRLQTLARTLRIEPRLVLPGPRPDIPTILAALDVFALSSRWEGLPLALLEAMAAGLPVVATRAGGVPEVVEDGVTGLLVPTGDPAALAEALGRLGDPVLRRQLGTAGRVRVEQQFSASQLARQLQQLYLELLQHKSYS